MRSLLEKLKEAAMSVLPNINSTVEIKKVITSNFEKLVSLVQNKIITITNIGKTDIAASFNFSNKLLKTSISLL